MQEIRKISLLLLLVLLVMGLSACAKETQEITEITFIHGWGSTEADHEIMRQIYKEFEVENPDIKINMMSMPTTDDAIRKAEDMIMTGTIPDVIFLGGIGTDTIYRYMVNQDYALNLMPYIEEDPVFAANIAPVNLTKWTTEDGALYSVSDVLILGGGYWYNADIFAAAGITELPATWEELESVCEQIEAWAAQENNEIQPMQLSTEGYLYFVDHILADLNTSVLDGELDLSQDSFFRALQILEGIYAHSSIQNTGYTYRDETSLFNEGKLAIYINGVWGASMIGDDINAAYALLPSTGQAICCESAGTGYVLGNTGDEKRQEASVRFLKYMMSEEVQQRILLETQQIPANPNIQIEDYAETMPRLCLAVSITQQADVKIEIPNQLWTEQQMAVFEENILSVLSGQLHKQTFLDLLR